MASLHIANEFRNLIFLITHPVGSYYISENGTSPAQTYGGSWEKISGYYLYADSSVSTTNYTGKGTQGHAITVNQMPSHSHNFWYFDCSPVLWPNNQGGGKVFDYENRWVNSTGRIHDTGGNQPHSHDIATKGVIVYKRIG